jgi:hypothetical protein
MSKCVTDTKFCFEWQFYLKIEFDDSGEW